MSDQLPMFGPASSPDSPSATSLPESESGVTLSVKRDGPTNAKSGPAPVPANPSARPAKAKRSTMKGIFGQSGFHSSKHEDLSFALASKLRPLTDSLGSTLFNLTWMTRATPAGRSISALRASEPLTEDSVCIGWPTPNARDFRSGMENRATGDKLGLHAVGLNDWAILAAWPTARAEDPESSGMRHSRGVADTMTAVASLTAWGTPAARDWKNGDASQETLDKNARPLNELAKLAGWGTPRVTTNGGYPSPQCTEKGSRLEDEAGLTAFGEKPIGFLLGPNGWEIVPASGQLNAGHSRWLMGLPPVWDDCGVTAMGSLRKRRKRSSKPI